MADHLHVPGKIVVGTSHLEEYAALAQCWCGLVAYLHNYALGPWPRKKDADGAFALRWWLGEVWREPDEQEKHDLEADSLLHPTDWDY